MLVNVDNDTLRRVLDSEKAMAPVERIEGWRALGDNVVEMIINKSEKVLNDQNWGAGERESGEQLESPSLEKLRAPRG